MRRHLRGILVVLLVLAAAPCFAQNAPDERTITVFGRTIHYWDVGSGPVVVLLHGLGSRKEDWLPVIPELSRKYRLLVPDQIGFGQSDKPLLDYSVQTWVDFLDQFLREMHVTKPTLVGESLGGWIGALYAVEVSSNDHMVPIDKLMLVDAAGLKRNAPIPNLNPGSLAEMRRVMELVFYDTSWLDDATLHKIFTDKLSTNDGYTVHSFLANPRIEAERVDDRLGDIHAPTLIIWGKQDQLVSLDAGNRYAQGIAGAHMVAFDKCGHAPPAEHTAEFLAAVEAFLSGAAIPAGN
ncbi:MAG TPA: alpha/beta hydrolase [Candidatus Limnocylindrales bacterium]|nr:alpha/beta hydrolase [Candidatus Limnocylindrales bacterium]